MTTERVSIMTAPTARGPLTQAERILKRLKEGPATSADFLDMYVIRYSARVHELRAEGHDIRWEVVRDRFGKATGLTRYWLEQA